MRAAASVGSLRMHRRIAGEAVIGPSPATRQAADNTATTGSAANATVTSPMVALQKPITYQDSVNAKRATKTMSSALNPPGESATVASQISPAMVNPMQRKNSTGRHASRVVGAVMTASSPEDRWSMEGLCECLRVFREYSGVGRSPNFVRRVLLLGLLDTTPTGTFSRQAIA